MSLLFKKNIFNDRIGNSYRGPLAKSILSYRLYSFHMTRSFTVVIVNSIKILPTKGKEI